MLGTAQSPHQPLLAPNKQATDQMQNSSTTVRFEGQWKTPRNICYCSIPRGKSPQKWWIDSIRFGLLVTSTNTSDLSMIIIRIQGVKTQEGHGGKYRERSGSRAEGVVYVPRRAPAENRTWRLKWILVWGANSFWLDTWFDAILPTHIIPPI
jgi:hypothetical protein